MNYVLKMPFRRGIKLIKKAQEKNTEEHLFMLYTGIYPNMDRKNFISFKEFLEKSIPRKIVVDRRSKDKLMKEIAEIEKQFNVHPD